MNKINNLISRIIIALVLAVLISSIARCQMVDNWQKNQALKDSTNLSMGDKPLTYYPNYEFNQSLDEVYPILIVDSIKIIPIFKELTTDDYNQLITKLERLQRELNFLGSEYQDLTIKIHELRIENDRLYHKIENLNKMVYKLYR